MLLLPEQGSCSQLWPAGRNIHRTLFFQSENPHLMPGRGVPTMAGCRAVASWRRKSRVTSNTGATFANLASPQPGAAPAQTPPSQGVTG